MEHTHITDGIQSTDTYILCAHPPLMVLLLMSSSSNIRRHARGSSDVRLHVGGVSDEVGVVGVVV